MKTLWLGILVIVLLGVGGLVYRNAIEHPNQPIACPLDAKVCPDGTAVARVGSTCDFPACAPPNVSLEALGISFALPNGFVASSAPDSTTVAEYDFGNSSSTQAEELTIREYSLASSTPLEVVQSTALGIASGAPLSATAFTSTSIGTHRFTVAQIGRFEGVVDTAYYLARGTDVIRFDAIDRGVVNWTDPALTTSTLPAQQALRQMLGTLQGN